MIKKTEIPFSSLKINRAEALRYAGVRGEADEQLLALYGKAFELLSECARPKAVYKKVAVSYTDKGVILDGDRIDSTGLKKFLQGAESAALLAATAGIEADRLITRYSCVEPSLALMIDALAAATVESLCNKMCGECFNVEEQRRFSPGYGDFPIEYQRQIISALSADLNAGIHLTNSLMLTPSKSVTAVVPLKGCFHSDN